MNRTSKTKMLAVALSGVALVASMMWGMPSATVVAAPEKREDGMDKAMNLVAEKGAQDCGRLRPRDDRTAADACTVAAFTAKKPFRVRYDLQGIDSAVSQGMVGTTRGELYMFSYDSDPSGGSKIGERVEQSKCANPVVVTADGKSHLECK